MNQLELTWHSDPSHGYLEVPLAVIHQLKLESKISRYSFLNGPARKVYLEEDCDAPQFITAATAAGIQLNMIEKIYTSDAPIRALPRY